MMTVLVVPLAQAVLIQPLHLVVFSLAHLMLIVLTFTLLAYQREYVGAEI